MVINGLKTPCFALETKRGAIPFISSDVLATMPKAPAMIAVSLSHMTAFCDKWTGHAAPISPVTTPGKVLFVNRDGKDGELPLAKGGLPLSTRGGRVVVSVASFMQAVSMIDPFLIQAPAPITTWEKSAGRHQKVAVQGDALLQEVVQDAGRWRDRLCVSVHCAARAPLVEASVQAGMAAGCVGVCLSGFGLGETMDQRREALDTALNAVTKEETVRIVTAVTDSWEELLDYVSKGVDVVVTSAPQEAAEQGVALVLDQATGQDRSLMLRDSAYKTSKEPIDPGCGCNVCAKHTRAYINHLLATQEMLGLTLLMMHNVHVLEEFTETVQRHIALGTFDTYKARFLATRAANPVFQ